MVAMKFVPAAAFPVVLAAASAAMAAGGSYTELFLNDPTLNGRGSIVGASTDFTFVPGAVTSHYNSNSATSKLVLPIGATLHQNTPFTMSVSFTIDAMSGVITDEESEVGNSQVAFGLSNSLTTGNDRTGWGTQNAYDLLTVDYFPTINKFNSRKPSLAPTLIETRNPAADYWMQLDFAYGAPSSIEQRLPLGVPLTAVTSYDPVTHVLSTTISAATPLWTDGPTSITQENDLDQSALFYAVYGDTFGFAGFALDQLGIYNWDNTGNILFGADAPHTVDITYTAMSVTWGEAVPEPATLSLLALGGAALLVRRRGTR